MTSLLAGRTALVTGGSMGIGFGIAQVLASHGARVAVTGLTDSELVDASSHGFLTLTLDVRDRSQCAAAVDAVVAEFGELTILCSNAGIYPQATIAEMTEKDVYDIFSINVAGTINMVQAAQQALADTGRGRVVVTSSITGNYTGFPAWSHYGATKAAQMGFVRSAALELAEDKTTINAVMPGNVLTPGLEAMGEAYLKQMAAAVPLGYLGEPKDIGEAVAFLASDGARYITGQSIVVDGGQILPESPDALK
ncbi:3-oxoacyl-ACP reductase FabG [Corynebacterium pyruviciproducens]|uniref:3-oxoacyl-ACP reductase FabG n=1 Tax=Corynebacterium pyruviciproducens TaxID=598660 RepID=A0AAF1BW78_9CORY|nr:3-oxoacyl-ACP reductase FabG [Corynebacterium pyruviciproducens]MDH4658098.1 3-oxoacyl-ACP reductase FabG [Corynebacterium pyruviciproducens]MDK7214300.1 3-oxoacyl-ACP reductase FabG [Corynebacterium pyruviciproducens]WOT02152.1 3-oxoacyl-ACP reductase FabG [Corynebacterium pyruviciproducens]